MVSNLNMSHGKMSIFVPLLLVEFSLVTKLGNFNFQCDWNTSLLFYKKNIVLDLNMPHGKLPGFVSIPLFWSNLVIKMRNFHFESNQNSIIFFDKKVYRVRFKYAAWKIFWFCFISIPSVLFSHKTEKFQFWKSLK